MYLKKRHRKLDSLSNNFKKIFFHIKYKTPGLIEVKKFNKFFFIFFSYSYEMINTYDKNTVQIASKMSVKTHLEGTAFYMHVLGL